MPPTSHPQPSHVKCNTTTSAAAANTTNNANKRKRPASAQTHVKAPPTKLIKGKQHSQSSSAKSTGTIKSAASKTKSKATRKNQSSTKTNTTTARTTATPQPPTKVSLQRGTPTPSSNLTPATTTPHTTTTTMANATTTSLANATGGANLYDAMLGEVSDLIKAASEAQACGRLKMASTYQLLVHARLIGLGKRFDRFVLKDAAAVDGNGNGNGNGGTSTSVLSASPNHAGNGGALTTGNHTTAAGRALSFPPPQDSNSNMSSGLVPTTDGTGTGATTDATNTSTNPSSPSGPITTAQTALAKLLPCDVDLDNTMMEHLARAAMELHHQRTRRGKALPRALSTPMSLGGGGGVASKFPVMEMGHGGGTPAAAAGVTGSKTMGTGKHTPTPSKTTTPSTTEGGASISTSTTCTPETKKRGGRTKKPPSRAMLTSGAASFDAKTILGGSLFRSTNG